MLVATASTLTGQRIVRYFGLVSGHALISAPAVAADGSPAEGYEQELRSAKRLALAGMTAEAEQLGANAVIAVDLDFETLAGSLLMVGASGTAVVVEEQVPAGIAAPAPPRLSAERMAALKWEREPRSPLSPPA